MRATRSDRGKVGLFSLLILAAIGYAAWQWGLPMFEKSLHKESKEEAAKEAEQKGQPVPTATPAPAPSATTGTPSTPPAGTTASSAAPSATATSGPSPDAREAEAHKALVMAQNFEANHMYQTAAARYEELIQKYPGTKAAEEAKPLLEEVKRK